MAANKVKTGTNTLPTFAAAAAAPTGGLLASGAAFDVVGGLTAYGFSLWANNELDKIRRPITQEMLARNMDSTTIALLDTQIQLVQNEKWEGMASMTVKQVVDVTVRTYERLYNEMVERSDNIKVRIEEYIEEKAKAKDKMAIEAKAQALRGEYNTLQDVFKFWKRNVEEMRVLKQREEDEVFADTMERISRNGLGSLPQ